MSDLALIQPARSVAFPQTYLEARNALARCELVDECKEMADKAAAIEVYARQSKDDSLVIMAQRIQARAIRRVGELLSEIPPVPPTHTTKVAGLVTRTTVATAAGLSEWRKNEAIQVAKVAGDKFEKLVESDRPPSVRALSKMGATQRYSVGRPKGGAVGSLRRALAKAEFAANAKAAELATALLEVNRLRTKLAQYLALDVT